MAGVFAQSRDLIIYSEAGEKFTLVVDGHTKNAQPAERVVARGIRNETPLLMVRFAHAGTPVIQQNSWLEAGKEYTLRITTDRQGGRVLRMQGAATLAPVPVASTTPRTGGHPAGGTATHGAAAPTGSDKQAKAGSSIADKHMGHNKQRKEPTRAPVAGEARAGDPVQGGSAPFGTAPAPASVRHALASPPVSNVAPPPATGPGCGTPMPAEDFDAFLAGIQTKGAEAAKLMVAKQIGQSHCLSTAQVKAVLGLFDFEDSKLDFAKFALDHVTDRSDYSTVSALFRFSSSMEEFNAYLQSR